MKIKPLRSNSAKGLKATNKAMKHHARCLQSIVHSVEHVLPLLNLQTWGSGKGVHHLTTQDGRTVSLRGERMGPNEYAITAHDYIQKGDERLIGTFYSNEPELLIGFLKTFCRKL